MIQTHWSTPSVVRTGIKPTEVPIAVTPIATRATCWFISPSSVEYRRFDAIERSVLARRFAPKWSYKTRSENSVVLPIERLGGKVRDRKAGKTNMMQQLSRYWRKELAEKQKK